MKQEPEIIRELQEIDEEVRWRAVQVRDASFAGTFLYGVRSTGIYCQPACPARRPRREQVVFFHACQAAEAAGFRACRRCRPTAHGAAASLDPQVEMVRRACRLIETHAEGTLSLAALGAELGVSPYHLQRTFKRLAGVTPHGYAAARRVGQFKARVREGAPVTDAMYDAGYNSSSRLYEKADADFGMTPAAYARGGRGMRIIYAVGSCSLGRLLVAATARGICAVRLGDSDAELEAALTSEFSAADIHRDDVALGEWIEPILEQLDGRRTSLDLPLDVQATAFQRRVWEELRRIPFGSTRTYGDIARRIGQPTAVRAVARACATNPVALITPCHRVIREGGELGGYRWGLERKRQLLAREAERSETKVATHSPNTGADAKSR